ncbi:unnamed protein product [Mesocestoides corti]|uniref:Amino acid transporter n=1 Tax=Mesocestoides corti TaxID=53468 RepID=A0A3P6HL50_MESCO|nr:unnamed protein product [Mesocestoides corti]
MDPKENGRISVVAFAFIVTSNVTAAICGTVASLLLKPGKMKIERLSKSTNISSVNQTLFTEVPPKTSDIFADLLYNLFPDNIVGVCLFQSRTSYVATTLGAGNEALKRTFKNIDSVNMLGLLFCSFVFGIAAGSAGEQGKPFLDFFKSVVKVVFKIMNIFLLFTPVGVCFMIAGPLASVRDLSSTLSQLGFFMFTVIVALVAHLIIMFSLYLVVARANPFKLLPYCFRTWLISFTTLAPVVAIPDLYKASDRFGIDHNISRFVVPLTAALKGDGSAAFLGASAIFIAQLSGTPITAASVVIVVLLSASAVFAIPNIPSSSLVILVTILSSLGVPVNYVGLLFAIDWLLDRCRTTNLAVLHLYCVAFTHYICRNRLHSKVHQVELTSTEVNGEFPASKKEIDIERNADNTLRVSDAPAVLH